MGKFIVIEGLDGCGKSSAINYLKTKLPDVVYVCDPYNKGVCSVLRDLVKYGFNNEKLCKGSELLVYLASRLHLMNTVIIPALNEGKTVISDRFDLSTYAYQGYGKGISTQTIQVLSDYIDLNLSNRPSIAPDNYIIFNIDVETALNRICARNGKQDQFENKPFLQQVYEYYNKYVSLNDVGGVKVLDAKQPIEKVHENLYSLILQIGI